MVINNLHIEVKLSDEEIDRISCKVIENLMPILLKLQKENDERLFTIKEVCQMKRKSRQTIYSYIKNGTKPFHQPVRVGRSVLFKKSDLINA